MKRIGIFSDFKQDRQHFFDLVFQKAWAGLKAEATRGYLGIMWWVIEPLMYMFVFYIAFSQVLSRGDENYVIFLLIGLIAWKWFQTTVITGSISLVANSALINQVYVPKIIFPLTNIAVNTFKFLIIIALFLVFLQFTPHSIKASWTMIPIIILVQLVFIMSTTCLLASIIPFFRDLHVILDNILMMLFFLSGIFFDINNYTNTMGAYLKLNPMAILIINYRRIIIDGLMPDWSQLMIISVFSLAILVLSISILNRFDREYPKIIY